MPTLQSLRLLRLAPIYIDGLEAASELTADTRQSRVRCAGEMPMKSLPHTADLLALAGRTVWYKPPGEAVADQLNLVAHVLTYGDQEDMKVLRRYLDLNDIRKSLDRAPPGVFDERSWSYCHGRTVSSSSHAAALDPGLTR